MTDVNGIMNMGFAGGQTGMGYMPNPFADNQAAMAATLANNLRNAVPQQNAQMAMWNAEAARMSQPTPPGYGQISLPYLSGSFGPAKSPGYYTAASGRSPFSGVSLGGGGSNWIPQTGTGANPGNIQRGPDLPDLSPARNPFISHSVQTPFINPAMSSQPRSPFTGMSFGGNRDFLANLMMRNASPAVYNSGAASSAGTGKTDRLPLYQGRGITDFGSQARAPTYSGGGIGSDMRHGNQNELYAKPWHSMIPTNRGLNIPEIIKQVNYTAGRGRYDPAALAGVIDTESKWDPTRAFGSYRGATQMGANAFKDFGKMGGMNFSQYQRAPLEKQIPAYGDWLANYARGAGNTGARLATSDIRHHPVPLQASILQATQFSPYGGLPKTPLWPQAFARGDLTSVSPSPIQPKTGLPAPQAAFLSPGGIRSIPPTLQSMESYYGRTIPR